MFKVLTHGLKEEWNLFVTRSYEYDFYHTWSYHRLEKSGQPLMFIYSEQDDFIAFPLIKRSIDTTGLFDLVSVYGYTGPLSNRKASELDEGFIRNFNQAFLDYAKKNNIVSVFARMHPFFNQRPLLQSLGGLTENGKTVAIDLRMPIEQQVRHYENNIKWGIKKLTRKGYYVRQARGEQGVALFNELYRENMQRVGATDCYLFDSGYFTGLVQAPDYDCRIFLVYADKVPVSGMLVTFAGTIMQSHLVATKTEFLKDSPAKYLVHYLSMLGRSRGMDFLHLGGGLGFKEDSLFKWKKGFSDHLLDFYTWRFIVDQAAYRSLLNLYGIDAQSKIDFFPLYRSRSEASKRLVA